MASSAISDPHPLRHEIAGLFNAAEHDVEISSLQVSADDALHVHTTLRSTARTSNATGTIYGDSLFTLSDLTGTMALFVCLLDIMQAHQPIVCTTQGGAITYLQAATGDVDCVLVLPASLVQSIRADLHQGRRAMRTLSLDMHDTTGQHVARATLTLSARRVRERTIQRLPIAAAMSARLRTLLTPRRAYAMGQ